MAKGRGAARVNAAAAAAHTAKERHLRDRRPQYPRRMPVRGLAAKHDIPKSKHETYYELAANDHKQEKPLVFEVSRSSRCISFAFSAFLSFDSIPLTSSLHQASRSSKLETRI